MGNTSTAAVRQTNNSSGAIGWAESGLLPDGLIRAGIRKLNRQRLIDISAGNNEIVNQRLNEFARAMTEAEIAPLPEMANEQHYEVPASFFDLVLGERRKYSCCYWDSNTQSLDEAEVHSLEITCERAQVVNGQQILDLGCGWGSLSLWIAENYPECSVTSVSNSHAQRAHINARAAELGLTNIRVITCDMNDFDIDQTFDRVVSVEMFEHMRNYPRLFENISRWLNPEGRFFMHIFTHKAAAYEFVDKGDNDWMSRHFFSGGMMPAADLPLRFQQHLSITSRWAWGGEHYQKTSNAWLANMDHRKSEIMPILADTYGDEQAACWFQRWRIFFMACAELFAHDAGQEWFVSHYLFRQRSGA